VVLELVECDGCLTLGDALQGAPQGAGATSSRRGDAVGVGAEVRPPAGEPCVGVEPDPIRGAGDPQQVTLVARSAASDAGPDRRSRRGA